jgi:putative SOS response-associated peptidase YedK
MCGRFTITADKVEFILKRFRAEVAPDFRDYSPRYNAAPAQLVPGVVAKEDGKRYLTNIFWGLTPPWAEKEGSKYSSQINIRSDTIEKNKFFRALLLGQRCIFVADGFYEWQAPKGYEKKPLQKGVRKTPYRVMFKNEEIFPLAGLWRTMKEGTKSLITGAIITTDPNKLMKPIHNRMPVILDDKALDRWLDPEYKNFDQLVTYMRPFPDARMKAYPVSFAVNNAKVDSPGIIEPA